MLLQNLSNLINFVNKLCDLNINEFQDKNTDSQTVTLFNRNKSNQFLIELVELSEQQVFWEDLQNQLDTIVKLYGHELNEYSVSLILQEILPSNICNSN